MNDAGWMREAVRLSEKCPRSDAAFSVGCVVLDAAGALVATGYSRELDGGMHAEEIALAKADRMGVVVRGGTVFSTLEPCHPRKSGKTSCTTHIINRGIARVVYAWREPEHFVTCLGTATLRERGIEVVTIDEFASEVRRVNAHILAALQPTG